MNETSAEVQPLTSVELLDAAVWREIGSEEPQPRAAFVEALSALVGRWLLVRSDAPEMDLVTLMCRARGYIERGGEEHRIAQVEPGGVAAGEDDGGRSRRAGKIRQKWKKA